MEQFIKTTKREAVMLPITKLRPFENHPYMVRDDAEMSVLTESINENGILSPLIVRPVKNAEDEYEVVSGHRRLRAAMKAGLETVPAFIFAIDRDAAAIMVVDSNLHREHILPSEKAFAYKMKLDALKHQGKICGQVGHKSREYVSDDESGRTIQRYIRLTNLIPELLDWMDEGRIALSVGVELSYLNEETQREVLEQCEINDCTPSYSQAWRMHKADREDVLTFAAIRSILQEEKANQKEMFKVPMERIRKYFPQSYTPAQIEENILRLCEQEHRRRMDRGR